MVVLAAGASTRLGRPKQLLPRDGRTLLWHAARTAREAALGPVLVVLGSGADACRTAIADLHVRTLVHEHWADGVGSTVAAAVRALAADLAIDAILIMPCDQPHVTPDDLRRLARAREQAGAAAAGAAYAGTVGVPAVFARSAFAALGALAGSRGAKPLLEDTAGTVVVPMPHAAFDVDTPAEARRLDEDTRGRRRRP